MITVRGRDLWRGGEKLGYVQGNDIYSHDNRKLGYVSGNHIYDHDGRKLGYLEGDYIVDAAGSHKTRIEDNHQHVSGGDISDLERAAIRFLLGD